jgi:hypothetical protein
MFADIDYCLLILWNYLTALQGSQNLFDRHARLKLSAKLAIELLSDDQFIAETFGRKVAKSQRTLLIEFLLGKTDTLEEGLWQKGRTSEYNFAKSTLTEVGSLPNCIKLNMAQLRGLSTDIVADDH